MRRKNDDAIVQHPRRKMDIEHEAFDDVDMYAHDSGDDGTAFIVVPKKTPDIIQSQIAQLAIKVRRKARNKVLKN